MKQRLTTHANRNPHRTGTWPFPFSASGMDLSVPVAAEKAQACAFWRPALAWSVCRVFRLSLWRGMVFRQFRVAVLDPQRNHFRMLLQQLNNIGVG